MMQLERRRRLSGKNFSQLAQASGIAYKRCINFFKRSGPLTLNEIERLSSLLPDDAAADEGAAVGNTPISGDNVDGSSAAVNGHNNGQDSAGAE